MKLKERPLDWWKGRKFTYWCRADRNDERIIRYTFNWYSLGQGHQVEHFTSEKPVNPLTMYRIQNSYIHRIELVNDEWIVNLDYPFYNPDEQ